MPFVNHLDGGEDFYVCDLSYGGNCCSASDETEHSMIKEHSERRGKSCGISVTITSGNVG